MNYTCLHMLCHTPLCMPCYKIIKQHSKPYIAMFFCLILLEECWNIKKKKKYDILYLP